MHHATLYLANAYCIIKGVVIVIYAVKLMEILIVVLLLNCGGFGKLQHFISSYIL